MTFFKKNNYNKLSGISGSSNIAPQHPNVAVLAMKAPIAANSSNMLYPPFSIVPIVIIFNSKQLICNRAYDNSVKHQRIK